MLSRAALLTLAICSCTHSASPAAAAPAKRSLVDDVTAALQRNDFAAASAAVDRGRAGDPELVAYYDATVHAYQGDVAGALRILHDHAARVGPTAQAAFSFHDAMIALRTADGDLLGALVEVDEMVRAGTLGTWSPADRPTVTALKRDWHRAYLLRMVAQTVTGEPRAAFLDYAERARQDYAARASSPDLADSVAVLDAYFAFCANDPAAMRAAVARVHVAQDDDVEDLYLVQLALDASGDPAAAEAVRKRIASMPFITVLTPVFLAWMRSDAAAQHTFSPKHPTAPRPAR